MSEELKITGKIVDILKEESGVGKTGKEWRNKSFVIEYGDKYPKKVCFSLFGDKISLIDKYFVDDEIEVFFNIESREFNGRWFTGANAWKIEGISQVTGTVSSTPVDTGLSIKEQILSQKTEPEPDDLPF
jgi:hypothetical protein